MNEHEPCKVCPLSVYYYYRFPRWEMTDEINDGKQRLLFLTNRQATILAQPDNISKLVTHAFEVNEPPKLLIVLRTGYAGLQISGLKF